METHARRPIVMRRTHHENPISVISMAANALLVALVISALYFARDVFIPLTLGTMLAFLLGPLADRLERYGLGRVPTVLVIAFVAFTVLGGLLWVIGREATNLASDIPEYQTEIVNKIENFTSMGSTTTRGITRLMKAMSDAVRNRRPSSDTDSESKPEALSSSDRASPVDDLDKESAQSVANEDPSQSEPLGSATNPLHTVPVNSGQSPLETVFTGMFAVFGPLTNFGLVIVFTIFMLVSRDDLRDRMIRILSGGRFIVTTRAIDEASRRISRYIVAQTIVNSIYGVCIGAGLWLIGVTLGDGKGFPNFALWGLLCTVLRFVPYLGPIIAGAFPVILSLIVFPGFEVFAATALLFVAIELLSNNVIEPWLYGSSTGMSAMAIILGAVFWTWMWGPVGLLLATPITASLVVLGKYVPQLRPLTVLLGDKSPLPAFASFYQRLLADDRERAAKILEEAVHDNGIENAGDDVIMAAIRRVRRDRSQEELTGPREHLLMQQITEMIDDVLATHCHRSAGDPEAQSQSTPTTEHSEDGAASSQISNSIKGDALKSNAIDNEHVTEDGIDCEKRIELATQDVRISKHKGQDAQPAHCSVIGCAAHHESEEPALKLLAYSLGAENIEMQWSGTRTLPSDVEEWIEKSSPKVIVIAIVPPGGFTQAHYMCERLHERLPDSHIIVAYFGKTRHYDKLLVRFRKVGASYFTTSLEQTRIQVKQMLEEGPKQFRFALAAH